MNWIQEMGKITDRPELIREATNPWLGSDPGMAR